MKKIIKRLKIMSKGPWLSHAWHTTTAGRSAGACRTGSSTPCPCDRRGRWRWQPHTLRPLFKLKLSHPMHLVRTPRHASYLQPHTEAETYGNKWYWWKQGKYRAIWYCVAQSHKFALRPCLVSKKHRIFGHMHRVLNVVEKITNDTV